MTDDSEKDASSLNNFEFLPDWENTKGETRVRPNQKKTKVSKKNIKEKSFKKRQFRYKITPYVKNMIMEKIKYKLKQDGVTRSIDSISKELTHKNLYEVTIESLEKEKKFLKLKGYDLYFFNEEQIIYEILHDENFVTIKSVEKISIKKENEHVLLHSKTEAVFPPTSHNLFNNTIDYYLIKNKIKTKREVFINTLTKSISKEHIEKLEKQGIIICVFKLKNTETFSSITKIIKKIKENKNGQFFSEIETAKIDAKQILKNKTLIDIKQQIVSNNNKIKKDISIIITRLLKKSKYNIFSKNKQTFVSAYYPNKYHLQELSDITKKIINIIEIHNRDDVKSIMEKCQKFDIPKIGIMKEIKWLIQIGIIRQYESGHIELIQL
jgi:hypothetical protein